MLTVKVRVNSPQVNAAALGPQLYNMKTNQIDQSINTTTLTQTWPALHNCRITVDKIFEKKTVVIHHKQWKTGVLEGESKVKVTVIRFIPEMRHN